MPNTASFFCCKTRVCKNYICLHVCCITFVHWIESHDNNVLSDDLVVLDNLHVIYCQCHSNDCHFINSAEVAFLIFRLLLLTSFKLFWGGWWYLENHGSLKLFISKYWKLWWVKGACFCVFLSVSEFKVNLSLILKFQRRVSVSWNA